MYLIVELFLSIILDGIYLFLVFYYMLDVPSIKYESEKILPLIGKILIGVSMILRLVILIKVYPYREPKVIKIYFYLCGKMMELHRHSYFRFRKDNI